eukprot:scaffold444067_cov28-Prasinocladus_malaysianus.AAC.1
MVRNVPCQRGMLGSRDVPNGIHGCSPARVHRLYRRGLGASAHPPGPNTRQTLKRQHVSPGPSRSP